MSPEAVVFERLEHLDDLFWNGLGNAPVALALTIFRGDIEIAILSQHVEILDEHKSAERQV